MKDIMTPVPAEEVRAVIKKCLENAALINYNKLASEAKVEGESEMIFPARSMSTCLTLYTIFIRAASSSFKN